MSARAMGGADRRTPRLLVCSLLLLLAGAPAARADDWEASAEQVAALLAGGKVDGTTYTNSVLRLRVALPATGWAPRASTRGMLAGFARRPGAGCLGVTAYLRRRDLPLRRAIGEPDPARLPGFTLSPVEKTERKLAGRPAIHSRQFLRADGPRLGAVVESLEQLIVASGDWIVALQWNGPTADAALWDEVAAGVTLDVDAPAGDGSTLTIDGELDRVAAAGKVEQRVWRNTALGVTLPLPDGFKPGVKVPKAPGERGKVLLAGESATSMIELRVDIDHGDPMNAALVAAAHCDGAARRLEVGGGRLAATVRGTMSGERGRLLVLGTFVSVDGWRLTLTWAGPPEDRSGEAWMAGLAVGER